ncbi:pYEATS domain-containing protein [Brucella anthropi]|uniref:Prokaryotic YEATS domain-containing protein n=1 Tax=Brucella anthropi TaxID=529 RepID=A0A6L3Z356_BRUAN|nr:pYEATS domain-containing protein [Brucella anthropi]KAB2765754.1 hypothetical protein F9L04_18400 [Brucella anthropi]
MLRKDRIAPAHALVDEVIAMNGDFAWFALHPTFSPPVLKVSFRGNRARLRVQACRFLRSATKKADAVLGNQKLE